jgi:hypothetical protein
MGHGQTNLVSLRRRRSSVEKVRDGGEKLGWRKRLGEHNAVRNAFGGPVCGVSPAHINNGNSGSISLACWATSQPSILPFRLMSVTSARYLPLCPLVGSLPLRQTLRWRPQNRHHQGARLFCEQAGSAPPMPLVRFSTFSTISTHFGRGPDFQSAPFPADPRPSRPGRILSTDLAGRGSLVRMNREAKIDVS